MNVHCTDIVPDEELNAKQVEKTPRLYWIRLVKKTNFFIENS